jgi:pimeloyl-ACP methyl ester carboxylesterase
VTAAPLADAWLRLTDGRQLAYCVWGDPGGVPVVLFHGAPGSRLMSPQPGVTEALGVRLVTFDRPGYGGSDARDGRELVDTPGDVVQLVDALGVERLAVVGVSAGGGHALACARAMPHRVAAVALVSASGPLDEVPGAWDALAEHYRPTAAMARREPHRAARAMVRYMARFVADPPSFLGGGPPADRAVARHPEYGPLLIEDATEAFRNGAHGMADDLVALWRPWGFAIAELPPGVWFWHGTQDTRAEPDFRYFTTTAPGSRARIWAEQGHLGIVPGWRDVLASVLRTC